MLGVGWGTAFAARALARHPAFSGELLVVDHGPAWRELTRRLLPSVPLAGRLSSRMEARRHLDLPAASVDIVLLHTLLSHVADPLEVLWEAYRVVTPGGTMAVVDGVRSAPTSALFVADYVSPIIAHSDPDLARRAEEALAALLATTPGLMHRLPHLLAQVGFEGIEALPDAQAEADRPRLLSAGVARYQPRGALHLRSPAKGPQWTATAPIVTQPTGEAAADHYAYLAKRPAIDRRGIRPERAGAQSERVRPDQTAGSGS